MSYLRKALVLIIIFIIVLTVGYSNTSSTKADNDGPFDEYYVQLGNHACYFIIVDKQTGVNYIVVGSTGNYDKSISPRYHADGTLYVTKTTTNP